MLINAGVYVVARELLDLIPSAGPVSLERDVFPPLVGPALRAVVARLQTDRAEVLSSSGA